MVNHWTRCIPADCWHTGMWPQGGSSVFFSAPVLHRNCNNNCILLYKKTKNYNLIWPGVEHNATKIFNIIKKTFHNCSFNANTGNHLVWHKAANMDTLVTTQPWSLWGNGRCLLTILAVRIFLLFFTHVPPSPWTSKKTATFYASGNLKSVQTSSWSDV